MPNTVDPHCPFPPLFTMAGMYRNSVLGDDWVQESVHGLTCGLTVFGKSSNWSKAYALVLCYRTRAHASTCEHGTSPSSMRPRAACETFAAYRYASAVT